MKKGSKCTQITKDKMSKAHIGKTYTQTTKNKIGNTHIGKIVTQETRNKLSDYQKRTDNSGENSSLWNIPRTQEIKDKISENHVNVSGKNNPMYGKNHTENAKQKMSKNHVDVSGENNSRWKGGISFGKYCKLFNNQFKKIVRNDYHNKCFLCTKTKEENNRELDVHHVNYNKDCLCGSPCEFVPLCMSCHRKTNGNRRYWEDLIMCYLYPNRYFIVDI